MAVRLTTVFIVVALVAIIGGGLAIYTSGIGSAPSSSSSSATTTIASSSSSSSGGATVVPGSNSSITVGGNASSTSASYPPYTNLPSGCTRPAGGILIIADINGFNDSIQHGAPTDHWPIITVKQGTTVNITICNSDHQAHGFQITNYFDSNIETIDPGQVVHVSFVADQVGAFEIYCSIFCSIHIYMQNGLLQVIPA